jgi:hypothetical protein
MVSVSLNNTTNKPPSPDFFMKNLPWAETATLKRTVDGPN